MTMNAKCPATAIEVDDTQVSIEGIHLANHTNDHVTRLRASFLNSFTYLPINIGQLFPRLQKMIIDEVKFIKKENFRGMGNLSTLLYLNLNQIETLSEDAFAELPNLQFLSLGNGKIKVLPENIFQQNPKLNSLDMFFGELQSIKVDFTKLHAIVWIQFYGNPCTDATFDRVWRNSTSIVHENF